MKSLSVLVPSLALVAGCAGAGTTPFVTVERAKAPALRLTSTEEAVQRSFPQRRSPARLPSANHARIADNATAGIRLCVAPDGTVTSVAIDKPSASSELDRALAADVPAWRFEPYRAPDGIKVCEQFTVSYVAR